VTRPQVWLLGVFLLTGCATGPREFHAVDPISLDAVSHQAFSRVLQQHVTNGRVNYPAVATDGRFNEYLRFFNRVDPSHLPARGDELAFWINAYNAFAIKGILDGFSPSTLWGRYRYFIARDYAVGGTTINLYDLEREVLVKQFREPRIHFAIVCASQSCPLLRSEAYEAAALAVQLDDSARRFINDSSKNRFDRAGKTAFLSMIFNWFRDDFEAHSGSLGAYVAQYVADPELARDLKANGYRIEFLDYDWSLNGVPPHDRPF
jgi:hypothetical protein